MSEKHIFLSKTTMFTRSNIFFQKGKITLNVQLYRSFILFKVSAIKPYQEGYNFYYIKLVFSNQIWVFKKWYWQQFIGSIFNAKVFHKFNNGYYYMTINISFIWLPKSMRFFLDRTLWILLKPTISAKINLDRSRGAIGMLY